MEAEHAAQDTENERHAARALGRRRHLVGGLFG
jgi:hypothetical protein